MMRTTSALSFCTMAGGVFATMAVTSFASGALVTTQGWTWLNIWFDLPRGLDRHGAGVDGAQAEG